MDKVKGAILKESITNNRPTGLGKVFVFFNDHVAGHVYQFASNKPLVLLH